MKPSQPTELRHEERPRDLPKKGVKVEKLALVQARVEAGGLFDEGKRAALA